MFRPFPPQAAPSRATPTRAHAHRGTGSGGGTWGGDGVARGRVNEGAVARMGADAKASVVRELIRMVVAWEAMSEEARLDLNFGGAAVQGDAPGGAAGAHVSVGEDLVANRAWLLRLALFAEEEEDNADRKGNPARRGSLQAYAHAHVPSPRTPGGGGRAPPAYDDSFQDDESDGESYED